MIRRTVFFEDCLPFFMKSTLVWVICVYVTINFALLPSIIREYLWLIHWDWTCAVHSLNCLVQIQFNIDFFLFKSRSWEELLKKEAFFGMTIIKQRVSYRNSQGYSLSFLAIRVNYYESDFFVVISLIFMNFQNILLFLTSFDLKCVNFDSSIHTSK